MINGLGCDKILAITNYLSTIMVIFLLAGESSSEKMWTVGPEITREEYLHLLDMAKRLDQEQAEHGWES